MNARPRASNALRAVGVVVGVLLILGLWPKRYLASPRWEVWVVTDDGQPLSGVNVRLVYQNFSVEGQDHEITMTADENGHGLFPPQYQRASFLRRVFYTLLSASAGVHASFGRHAYILVFGRGYEGQAESGKYVTDWRGSPESTESKIVAKRRGQE